MTERLLARAARPVVESLEGRTLMSSGPADPTLAAQAIDTDTIRLTYSITDGSPLQLEMRRPEDENFKLTSESLNSTSGSHTIDIGGLLTDRTYSFRVRAAKDSLAEYAMASATTLPVDPATYDPAVPPPNVSGFGLSSPSSSTVVFEYDYTDHPDYQGPLPYNARVPLYISSRYAWDEYRLLPAITDTAHGGWPTGDGIYHASHGTSAANGDVEVRFQYNDGPPSEAFVATITGDGDVPVAELSVEPANPGYVSLAWEAAHDGGGYYSLSLFRLDADGTVQYVTGGSGTTGSMALPIGPTGSQFFGLWGWDNYYGGYSNFVPATGVPAPPAAPTSLTATLANADGRGPINLLWNNIPNNEDEYVIEYSTDGTTFTAFEDENAADDTTFQVKPPEKTGWLLGMTYSFRVKATNEGGDSSYSNVASVSFPRLALPCDTGIMPDGTSNPGGPSLNSSNSGWSAGDSLNGQGSGNDEPVLAQLDGNDSLTVFFSPGNQLYFDWDAVNERYVEDFGGRYTLVRSGGQFTLTDSAGSKLVFSDSFTDTLAGPLAAFASSADAGGNKASVFSRDLTGRPTEVRVTNSSNVDTESWIYSYVSSGANTGLLQSVTQRQKDGSGNWVAVRTLAYTYYDGTTEDGLARQIKTATVTDGASNTLETHYYRYYADTDANGFAGALKYSLGDVAYRRLLQAHSVSTADGLSDLQLTPYADVYLEYDADHRIALRTVQGEGCSTCTGGQGTYTYAYAQSTHADGVNSWHYKTTESLPDGNQNITYYNYNGQVMLSVFKDATGQMWGTFHLYDADGREVLTASPSAVALPASLSTIEANADLLNYTGGNYQYLSDSAGNIQVTDYYASTTATSSVAGGVSGYQQHRKVKQGETGTAVLLSSMTYIAHSTSSGATVYPVAAETAYRNTDGSGGQTTSYSYTWYTDSLQEKERTVTYATVTTAQNGSNAANTETVVYDAFGRVVWSKDGQGYISYTAYDEATGGVIKTIRDVDHTGTGDFDTSTFPSGWTTPTGGGVHLVTTTAVDTLGRTTKVVDANGNVTYTVFNDANYETRVYRGWNATTGTTTGPIEVIREDRARGYVERLTMSATPAVSGSSGSYVPTGGESISSLQSLTRDVLNDSNQVVYRDAYVTQGLTYSTGVTIGTAGTDYLRTEFGYDWRGRQARVKSPDGTWTHTVYDGLDRVVSTWQGTNNTGWTQTDPSNGGAGGNNMVKVSENVYDDGGVGDSNLTESMAYAASSTTYDTTYAYDFRNRTIGTRGPDGVATKYTYDNLGAQTLAETYADADADFVIDGGELRRKTVNAFDERGRIYSTLNYKVDPTTGIASDWLATNVWYDARGNVIKTADRSNLFQKTTYDGGGRAIATYVSSQSNETAYADADDVSGDKVIEQTKTIYDAAGRPVLNTSYKSFYGSYSPATGELAANNSFIETMVAWYDRANRPIATANYGRDNGVTNGVSGGTRYVFNSSGVLIDADADGLPDEAENTAHAPNTSDDFIVSKVEYDAAGRAYRTTDNGGRVTETTFDMLGRQTKVVENHIDGTLTESETDTDRTTTWTYDTAGRPWKMTARNPKGSNGGSTTDNIEDQVTTYLYESPVNAGWATNTIYPDSADTTSAGTDQVEVTYDRLGRQLTSTDQRGVVHTYAYDAAGRLRSDAITTLPSGVDGAIRRIERTYDDLSRVQKVTSYDSASAGNVVNEVKTTYDGWGNAIKSEQAHAGAVTTGMPSVQYTYSGGAYGVSLSSVIYPDGRTFNYSYDTAYQATLGQVTGIYDTNYAILAYFYWTGADIVTQVGTEVPSTGFFVDLNYGISSDLDGFDRFGRIVRQEWTDNAYGKLFDSVAYTYDRNSNRLTADHAVDSGYGSFNGHDSVYTYDGLDRLTGWERGTFSSGTMTNAVYTQDWDTLDALGNWQTFTSDTNGATSGGATTQNRTHNAANEMTSDGGSWLDPVYDAGGNMTTMPVAGNETTAKYLIYDGWNRLVGASHNDDGDATDAQDYRYSYDGSGRRIRSSNGTGTAYTDYYLSEKNQILETRINGETETDEQFLWGPTYVDALLARIEPDVDEWGFQLPGSIVQAMYDANYNVIGLVTDGGVALRYEYTPYGLRTEVNAALDVTLAKPLAIGHQGLWHDTETGLVYNRARMLHATLGRFVQRDPAGYVDGPNMYQYVLSNPLGGTDPQGLCQIDLNPNGPRPPAMGTGTTWNGTNIWPNTAPERMYHLYVDPKFARGFFPNPNDNLVLGGNFLADIQALPDVIRAMKDVQKLVENGVKTQLCAMSEGGSCTVTDRGSYPIAAPIGQPHIRLSLQRFTIYWESTITVGPANRLCDASCAGGSSVKASFSGTVKWTLYDRFDFRGWEPYGWIGTPFNVFGSWNDTVSGTAKSCCS